MTFLFDVHFTRTAPQPGESATGRDTMVGRARSRQAAIMKVRRQYLRRYQGHRAITQITDQHETAEAV